MQQELEQFFKNRDTKDVSFKLKSEDSVSADSNLLPIIGVTLDSMETQIVIIFCSEIKKF